MKPSSASDFGRSSYFESLTGKAKRQAEPRGRRSWRSARTFCSVPGERREEGSLLVDDGDERRGVGEKSGKNRRSGRELGSQDTPVDARFRLLLPHTHPHTERYRVSAHRLLFQTPSSSAPPASPASPLTLPLTHPLSSSSRVNIIPLSLLLQQPLKRVTGAPSSTRRPLLLIARQDHRANSSQTSDNPSAGSETCITRSREVVTEKESHSRSRTPALLLLMTGSVSAPHLKTWPESTPDLVSLSKACSHLFAPSNTSSPSEDCIPAVVV